MAAGGEDKAMRVQRNTTTGQGQKPRMSDDPHLKRTELRAQEGVLIRATALSIKEADFQHSLLASVHLPISDPGDLRDYARRTYVHDRTWMTMTAGTVVDAQTGVVYPVGLPFGPKARLLLLHLTTEAKRKNTKQVELGGNLTAYVKKLELDDGGRTLKVVRNQLLRLAAASIQFQMFDEQGRSGSFRAPLFDRDFGLTDVWADGDPRQTNLWAASVTLSDRFFDSVKKHSVPLDGRAIKQLKESALALDVYSWLAYRLHRIDDHEPERISWEALMHQFGPDYTRARKFRERFADVLDEVRKVYGGARKVTEYETKDGRPGGLILPFAEPPIPKEIE